MKFIVASILLLSIALSDLTCSSSQTYVKFTKKCGASWASEESFEIYAGGSLVYTSPIFANSETRVIEQCLTSTTNNQYELKMKDSYGDSWYTGSWLMIEGPYSNRIFKNMLTASSLETYTISLYTPIMKQSQWKLYSGTLTDPNWTQYNFGDSSWSQVTLGSVTTTVSGTQYFRKQFTGVDQLAAYELAMNYRYGIIAYINGNEIYRDNMPEGTVTSGTVASGSYTAVEYHNIIRPGGEVKNAQTVLAVELHFLAAGQTFVDFDAFLAIYASSITEDQRCYVYAYDTTLTATLGSSVANMFDYSKTTSFYMSSTQLPSTVSFAFDGPKPYLNGIRVWPYTSPTSAPNNFVFQGTNNIASTWTNIISVSGITHVSSEYHVATGYFNSGLYSNYRLTITGSATTYVYAYEVQPITCSIGVPDSVEFESTPYTFYATYEEVYVRSLVTEFTNCNISPAPAPGLTFDQVACALSGKVNSAMTQTYQVTSVMNGQTYSGSFTLQIVQCAGSVVSIKRTYKTNAVYEYFSVIDTQTSQPVYSITQNSGQINSADWETIVCLTGAKYSISLGCGLNYWASQSVLYINAMLDGADDYETILRVRYDNYQGLPNAYTFNAQYSVKPNESWYYKMGEVPANWYNSETSGWISGSAGSFPASSNQIQLYKRTFTVSSVTDVAGIVISLKYQYGVIIYLNNNEVFRKGFTGDLSTSTYSSTSITSGGFHQISLPIKTFGTTENPSVNYVTAGSNTIAIGLIAAGPAQTAAAFDCAIRLMGMNSVSRINDNTYSYSGTSGYPTYLSYKYYSYYIYQSTCSTNYYYLTFSDDRHEWISSIAIKLHYTQAIQQPRQFTVLAKNYEDSTWTTLKQVSGLTWSLAGQEQRIWLDNNKSYNQYRIENIGTGNPSDCYWKMSYFDLYSDAIQTEPASLSYAQTTEIYKDVEMGELYPSSTYYTDFTINPALPTGVTLNPYTGMISGTASAASAATIYTISAKKLSGETASAQMTLTVAICTGGRSLITLVARTDSYPTESSYKVYQGKGTSGNVVASIDHFTLASNLNYGDFCLNHAIYTLELRDTSTGWTMPAGYYLTVDVGALKFEMGQVYKSPAPASVTTMFSSFLPFQIEYDDWKVYTGVDAVASDWNAVDFNDATWTVTKAAQIGTSEAVTVYIRRDVNIPDIADYQVLNVRVKYAGGVVAYFNGRTVARFNLEENFDASTQSIAVHDSNTFSVFHIILPTVGGVTGKNVIAFEIHRPLGQPSSEAVVFDATGIFGVNECSPALDTVLDVTGTAGTTIGDLANFFDLSPVTYGYQPNAVGTYLQWHIENLEGTKFNSFAIQSVYVRSSWGFSLYGRENFYEDDDPKAEEYTSMFAELNLSTPDRGRAAWPVPVGIAGFRQFKWEVDDTANSYVYICAYIFQYCRAGEGACPAIGDYPAVAEGQISPGECDYGFRGYSYRECTNGQLGEVKNDKCIYKVPANMNYDSDRYTLVMNTQSSIQPPTYMNLITKFKMADNTFLPDGLDLDETTGAITGIPTSEVGLHVYTIQGVNPSGMTFTEINISVRKGECKAEGNFPKTQVGEIAEYECSLAGSYIGTQKRACLLGAKDGEWQKIQGVCMPTMLIIVLVLVVIIIIVVIVFFVMRATTKTKAVGGVKGKKSTKSGASKKTLEKKPSAKAIKV